MPADRAPRADPARLDDPPAQQVAQRRDAGGGLEVGVLPRPGVAVQLGRDADDVHGEPALGEQRGVEVADFPPGGVEIDACEGDDHGRDVRRRGPQQLDLARCGSRDASLTRTTASAADSSARTPAAGAPPGPPAPGVSISVSPSASSGLGLPISACSHGASAASSSRPVTAPASRAVVTSWRPCGPTSTVEGSSACATTVGRVVATSGWTGQTSAPTRAPTRLLLPCL